jgi:hypothetical protein
MAMTTHASQTVYDRITATTPDNSKTASNTQVEGLL